MAAAPSGISGRNACGKLPSSKKTPGGRGMSLLIVPKPTTAWRGARARKLRHGKETSDRNRDSAISGEQAFRVWGTGNGCGRRWRKVNHHRSLGQRPRLPRIWPSAIRTLRKCATSLLASGLMIRGPCLRFGL